MDMAQIAETLGAFMAFMAQEQAHYERVAADNEVAINMDQPLVNIEGDETL